MNRALPRARARVAVAAPSAAGRIELARRIIVIGCAAALILAERALPF